MSTATILNFPVRLKSEFCPLNFEAAIAANDADVTSCTGVPSAHNPEKTEAFWLAPGEAENNLETLFWFRGEDPLHHAPKLVDIEEIALNSRTWLRRLTVLDGTGADIKVLGHASFEERWDIHAEARKLILSESHLPIEWCEDLQVMLEAESTHLSTPPTIHLVGSASGAPTQGSNPCILGLV